MLEGLFAAGAGMQAAQTQLGAISNNIANEDTPGYQAELTGFQNLLYTTDNDDPSTARVGAGAAAETTGFSQAQGALQQTGNPLDVAIEGNGYLEVRQRDGTIGLTRNGTLQLNARGQITTSLGMELEPPITLPKGTSPSQVQIGPDGTVSVAGKKVGALRIVDVPAPDRLLPRGSSVYSATAASGAPTVAKGTTVKPGFLEQSNVDLNVEISEMMTAQQSYDLGSRAVAMEGELGQIAATLK